MKRGILHSYVADASGISKGYTVWRSLSPAIYQTWQRPSEALAGPFEPFHKSMLWFAADASLVIMIVQLPLITIILPVSPSADTRECRRIPYQSGSDRYPAGELVGMVGHLCTTILAALVSGFAMCDVTGHGDCRPGRCVLSSKLCRLLCTDYTPLVSCFCEFKAGASQLLIRPR